MSAHTPGRWKWEFDDNSPVGAMELVRDVDEPHDYDSICYHGADWPMKQADRDLIAAAPELLAALEQTAAALNSCCLVITDKVARDMALDMVKDARAALAKAKGGSMTYIVQVLCTGMGWVDSRYQSDSWAVAHDMEKELRADDSKWVNPKVEKQTRIVSRAENAPAPRLPNKGST